MLASVSFPMTEAGKRSSIFGNLPCGGFEPQRDDSPQIVPGGGYHVERRCSPEINHNERTAVFPEPGDGVAETVRPHGGWIRVEDSDAEVERGGDGDGFHSEVFAGKRLEHACEVGDDGRYADAVDCAYRDPPVGAEALYREPVLVHRAVGQAGHPPVRNGFLPVVDADYRVRVTDIDGKKH
jgi:hypothetical protein